jgi:hypothetical protein
MLPDNLRKELGDRGVDEIVKVVAQDGSGRTYGRGLTRGERERLAPLLGRGSA